MGPLDQGAGMRTITLLLAGTIMASTAQAQPSAQADVALSKVNNQYICVFNESVTRGDVRTEAGKAVNPVLGQILAVYEHTIRGFAVRLPAEQASPQAQMARLKANNAKIAYCEQDQTVRALVQSKGKPGGGGSTGQTTPWGVERVGGSVSVSSPASKTAWIIDTGIDLDHPDLRVDVPRSVSFIRDNSPDDQNGHGTHVAGTIAAINNEIGVVGVAAGNVVVAVRVLDRRGSGTWSGVIAGVDHVGEKGNAGDVANMSLGGGFSQAVNDAVIKAAAAGIYFTIAAGNDGANANNFSPASANGDNIYTVSAIDRADKFASWSNWGNPPVDWAEPGVGINSTYKDGGYRSLSGTSMAAPHVAGILLIQPVSKCGNVASGDPDGAPDAIGCH